MNEIITKQRIVTVIISFHNKFSNKSKNNGSNNNNKNENTKGKQSHTSMATWEWYYLSLAGGSNSLGSWLPSVQLSHVT